MERQTIDVEELRRLADARFWEAHKNINWKDAKTTKELQEAAILIGEAQAWQYLTRWLNDYQGNGKS